MKEYWKRNLVFVWLSQFLSIGGFMFCLPFAPYYIQALGVTDPFKLKMAVMLFGMATPMTMAFAAPVWGTLADRYGRRIMLLRANAAAVLILAGMGMADSVAWLIVWRLAQGFFTGTLTASQAMVAVHTPNHRSGLALGALSAAVNSGGLAGAFLGGLTAEVYGYRTAFYVAAALMALAFLCVALGTRESRPARVDKPTPLFRWGLPELHGTMPIVSLVALIAIVRHFDQSFYPLLVQDIHGSLEGAAIWAGSSHALCAVAGILAGFVVGHLADRIAPARIAMWSAAAAMVFVLPHMFLNDMYGIMTTRFFLFFCIGAIDPIFHIWMAKSVPAEKRASVFGWACTARCLGWMMAPAASGVIAATLNLRAIYAFNAVFYVVMVLAIRYVMRWAKKTS